jgi:hypothetical protein
MSCCGIERSSGRACRAKVVNSISWDGMNLHEYCKKHARQAAENMLRGTPTTIKIVWALKELGYINDNSR